MKISEILKQKFDFQTNGVALTTVMAAQKALELSILPDEVEGD